MQRVENPWEIEVSDYHNLNIQFLEKVLDKGNEYSDGLLDDFKSLNKKSYTILSILISLTGVFVSYAIGSMDAINNIHEKIQLLSTIILISISTYCIHKLTKIISPQIMVPQGTIPKKMNYRLAESLEKNEQYRVWLMNEIKNTQIRIDYNKIVHSNQITQFEKVLNIITLCYLLAITGLLATFIIKTI